MELGILIDFCTSAMEYLIYRYEGLNEIVVLCVPYLYRTDFH
jgi:hypothetical protein